MYALAPDTESAEYLARFGFYRKQSFPPVFGGPASLMCADFVNFNVAKPLDPEQIEGPYPPAA